MGDRAPNRTESHPRVSVIIPVYKADPTIGATIQSALAQTFRDFEILVVDDGSTDSTALILKRFASRITIIKQANRTFATLATPDRELPRRLPCIARCGRRLAAIETGKSIAVLDRSPQVVLVYTDVINQDAAGRAFGNSPIEPATAHALALEEVPGRLCRSRRAQW